VNPTDPASTYDARAHVSALFDEIKPPPAPELSPDDVALLEQLGDGWSEQYIAREQSLPIEVIHEHLAEIIRKLRARSLFHALAIAFRTRLLPLERRQDER
jgi:DNA-binding NarL/FixJ family response regulator